MGVREQVEGPSLAHAHRPQRPAARAAARAALPQRIRLLALLLVLQLADAAITRFALAAGAAELNPLMRAAFDAPVGVVEALKAAGVAVIAGLVLRSAHTRADKALRLAVLVSLSIVVWNAVQVAVYS